MRILSKQHFIFILSLIPFLLQAGNSLVIGVMKNAPTNDRIAVQVHHYYLDGGSDTYRTTIGKGGHFSVEVDIPESQYVFVKYRSNYIPVYLEPNDTVALESDLLQFPMVVNFSGKGGGNNNALRSFLEKYPINFNEFSKSRYQIGGEWCTIDTGTDGEMRNHKPESYKAVQDKKSDEKLGFLDAEMAKSDGKMSMSFYNFLSAEILYTRAYELLFYGKIYKNMHEVHDGFFEILYDVSPHCDYAGSPAYRRFIMAYIAHRAELSKTEKPLFQKKYLLASDLLTGRSLAFYRSEIIFNGLKDEKYAEVLPFYTSFLENNEIEAFEEKVADEYQMAMRVSPGTVAPNFTGQDMMGQSITLSDLRGKVVYINFWASYCGSCIKKINAFNTYMSDLQSAGVVVLNVSMDKNATTWRNAISAHNVQGMNMNAQNDAGENIAKTFSVEAIPHYFIVGKDGTFQTKPLSSKPSEIKSRLMELTR